ncbi:MAG: hypothetical protein ACXWFY_07935 [Chthoniobacterales bacterium]
MIKIAFCLLAVALLAACQSTNATASRQTAPRQNLQQRAVAQNATIAQPAPPAEGPEDVPANASVDPNRNPGLLPSPLLRRNAIGGL